jgi:hypothetical protein
MADAEAPEMPRREAPHEAGVLRRGGDQRADGVLLSALDPCEGGGSPHADVGRLVVECPPELGRDDLRSGPDFAEGVRG